MVKGSILLLLSSRAHTSKEDLKGVFQLHYLQDLFSSKLRKRSESKTPVLTALQVVNPMATTETVSAFFGVQSFYETRFLALVYLPLRQTKRSKLDEKMNSASNCRWTDTKGNRKVAKTNTPKRSREITDLPAQQPSESVTQPCSLKPLRKQGTIKVPRCYFCLFYYV